MTSVSPAPPRKLPVWATVASCYGLVLRNFGELLRIAWLPVLLLVPVYIATYWLTWPFVREVGQATGVLKELLLALPSLLELPFLASIAVAWHRYLLRPETHEPRSAMRLDRKVWRYAALSLALLALSTGGLYYPVSPTPETFEVPLMFVLVTTAMILALFAVARLSIALPAIALDEPVTPAQAWRCSHANTWRLAIATTLCVIPPLVIASPLYWYMDWQRRAESVALGTAASLVDAIFVIFGVTLLSLAYRFFILREDGPLPPRPVA